jgi:altronate dehydratase
MSERVAAAGGRAVLTEIPEIFGAETSLLERAQSREVFDEAVAVVNDFKQYFIDHGQPVHENPSPGNRAGGITTLEEKSLGAVQKGGRAPLAQVLRYGEQAMRKRQRLLFLVFVQPDLIDVRYQDALIVDRLRRCLVHRQKRGMLPDVHERIAARNFVRLCE